MGLDMYAVRRTHVKKWKHEPPSEEYSVQVTKGGEPVADIDPERISQVDEEVMYWRKANHIHAWFVENVQDGIDNCASYYVSDEKLEELLGLCKRVIRASKLVDGAVLASYSWDSETKQRIENREAGKVIKNPKVAQELLPRQEGFFFGGYEYDEWYLKDVQDTHDWIVQTFKDRAKGILSDIYYSSSW